MKLDEWQVAYSKHHAESLAIAATMRTSDTLQLAARAQRMEACGTIVDGFECPDCGEFHVLRTSLCRDRLCPNCGYVLTRKRAGNALAALEALNEAFEVDARHLVLTIDHTRKSDLRELLRTLTRGYGRLMRNPGVARHTVGSIRSVEITHSDRAGFHPHIHALVASPKGAPAPDTAEFTRLWRQTLGLDYDLQVDCKLAYAGHAGDDSWGSACAEACKYAIKPGWLPSLSCDQMLYAAEAIRGARLMSSQGALSLSARPVEIIAPPGPAERTACSTCASTQRERRVELRYNHVHQAFEDVTYDKAS